MATTTTAPRGAARLRRIDLRVVVGLLLVIAGVLGVRGWLVGQVERTPVLIAARPVRAGAIITGEDLAVAELGLTAGVTTLGREERERLVGQVAAVPLAAGQVLTPQVVAETLPVEPGQVVMSVGLAPERAAGGLVAVGHRVDVLAVSNPDRDDSRGSVLLRGVRVLAVAPPNAAAGEAKLVVTVALDEQQAPALAKAEATGELALAVRPQEGQ